MNLIYLWSKLLRKLRGAAIKKSSIHKTSKVEAGSQIVNTLMDKYSFCGYDCDISNCEIGCFTSIANGVVIVPGIHIYVYPGVPPLAKTTAEPSAQLEQDAFVFEIVAAI